MSFSVLGWLKAFSGLSAGLGFEVFALGSNLGAELHTCKAGLRICWAGSRWASHLQGWASWFPCSCKAVLCTCKAGLRTSRAGLHICKTVAGRSAAKLRSPSTIKLESVFREVLGFSVSVYFPRRAVLNTSISVSELRSPIAKKLTFGRASKKINHLRGFQNWALSFQH